MIIPIRCFTCGKVLANMWKYYEAEVKKLEEKREQEQEQEQEQKPQYKNFEGIPTKEILDKLGLKKICCRRHMLTHVDMIDYI